MGLCGEHGADLGLRGTRKTCWKCLFFTILAVEAFSEARAVLGTRDVQAALGRREAWVAWGTG